MNAPRAGTTLGFLLAAAALAACGDAGGRSPVSVDTLEDGRVVVSSRPEAGDSLRLVETLRIGHRRDQGPDAFGDVSAVAAGTHGRIYVADGFAHEIRAFDSDGRHLWSGGGPGGGPEQFGMISGMVGHPDGGLWVQDAGNGRLAVLDSAGTFVDMHSRELGRFVTIPWTGRLDATGRLYEKKAVDEETGERKVVARHRLESERGFVMTGRAPVPEVEVPTYTIRRSSVIERSPVPYAPGVLWAVGPAGHLWIASTDTYRLHEVTFDGDTLQTVELQRPPPPVTAEERDSVVEATGLPPDRLPGTKPVLRWIAVDGRGRLWVWPRLRAGESPVVDVFGADGRYMGAARAEVDLFDHEASVLPAVRGGAVVGVTRDRLGVPFVVRLEIRGLEGTREMAGR